jgi:hypothetical protein
MEVERAPPHPLDIAAHKDRGNSLTLAQQSGEYRESQLWT